MSPVVPKRTSQKTYSHLLAAGRMPSDYEVVTSQLLYYRGRDFAVDTPVAAWYGKRVQVASADSAQDRFADPRETTYASYVRLKREQEIHLERVAASDAAGQALSAAAQRLWAQFFAVARYPLHGLQMLAGFAGSMAPCGRVAVALAFQAADEMQRVHCLAYRLAQLRRAHPGLGDDARAAWQRLPHWQALRELIERLLVVRDGIETLLALNTMLKPLWEGFLFEQGAVVARRCGEVTLGAQLECFAQDGRWHRDWSAAAIAALWPERNARRAVVGAARSRWDSAVTKAMQPLARALDALDGLDCAAQSQLEERIALRDSWLTGLENREEEAAA